MPLLLELRYGDKVVINGAVIENISSSTSRIVVHNRASILRQREFLPEAKAVTPASRTYFMLQGAYMFPAKEDEYLKQFNIYLDEYEGVAPSSKEICATVRKHVLNGDTYKGMKSLQDLLRHEQKTCPALYNPQALDVYIQQLNKGSDSKDVSKKIPANEKDAE